MPAPDDMNARRLDAHGFLNVVSRAEFMALLTDFPALDQEDAPLAEALGRVLACDLPAPEDLPQTARASMDGYAVSARDVFGATETNPAYVDLVADLRIDWAAGMPGGPAVRLAYGQAARIPTGGTLPEGADAVVMVEHTELLPGGDAGGGSGATIEVRKSAAPGENVLLPGEDVRQGESALPRGRVLRAQDVGLLAALGQTVVRVGRRPVVGVVSTGDELVPPNATPRPGQIRDVNSSALCCRAAEAGALPRAYGIVPDDLPRLAGTLACALAECDVVLLSGGSSIGARDHSVAAMLAQPGAEILAHGVAISPGKPTILARAEGGAAGQHGGKAILGLPGQVTSAQVVMTVLVKPFLRRLAGGEGTAAEPPFVAELARNIAGRPGREDFVRVRLEPRAGQPPLAHPVLGKSGLLKTLLAADGLVAVPATAEGLYKGAFASVWPL